MSESWLRDYIQLALRIDKVFHIAVDLPFVDYYYGPPEWKAELANEPAQEPLDLLRATTQLLDALPAQGFDAHRTTHLSKQVIAMEMVSRKLNGEMFTFAEELQHIFDIQFAWIPETQLEEGLALYDEALPGKGTLTDRLHAWRTHHQLPLDKLKNDRVPVLIERIMAEIRHHTQALVALPDGESVDLQLEMDSPFGGACWYHGNYRSQVEINLAAYQQGHINLLVDTLCHEIYPGHHTTSILHEYHLYREHKRIEESIGLIFSPGAVIGEGIATSACEMIFSPQELEQWLTEQVYPELGIEPQGEDVTKLQRAFDLLEGAWGNAAFLFRDKRPDDEVEAYLTKYLRRANIAFWQQPFHDFFPAIEYYGKRLVQPHLQGANRQAMFRRLLTEQMYPSELVV